ncbi:MAG TPA: OmpA family protein [Gemmatimonadaceae bacterium]|nr:OmpA family protein [Gemmatimonadaceae bacterium]
MHTTRLKTTAVFAIVAPVLAGCATKGYVRDRVAEANAYTDSTVNVAMTQEKQERMAADSALSADVNSLRRDLDSLRSEFGAKITALEEGLKFDMPVHFAFDDATLRDEDRPVLDRFAQIVQKYYPGSVITVEGFADPAGTNTYNKRLSERRAQAVSSYLGSAGLSNELRTVGYGETRQVVPGAWGNDAGADQNRRVVFVIETSGSAAQGVATATP